MDLKGYTMESGLYASNRLEHTDASGKLALPARDGYIIACREGIQIFTSNDNILIGSHEYSHIT